MRNLSFFIAAGTLLSSSGIAVAAGDVIHGQKLYQKTCVACHSVDYNAVGPAHKGIFNRKVGSAANYTYSPALRLSTIVWNAKTLDKWLTDPEKFIPGQKMGVKVVSAKDRADLIAYLKTLSE